MFLFGFIESSFSFVVSAGRELMVTFLLETVKYYISGVSHISISKDHFTLKLFDRVQITLHRCVSKSIADLYTIQTAICYKLFSIQ